MATTPGDPVLLARSAIGHAVKTGNPRLVRAARAQLAAARIEREIRAALADTENPISGQERRRLARMLTIGAPDA